jgi:glycosyltransferase involved in cell wall biosynthesis
LSMKICLLSYRGHPFGGGQGIYIHNLSKALVNLGHEVDLLSGNPHPVVVDAVRVHKLESLDAYSWTGHLPPEPLRLAYPLNLYEAASVMLGGFPEPFTFSIRAHRKLWSLSRYRKFDVIHDNQCLGYGILLMKQFKIPIVCTIHHPASVDRELDIRNAKGWMKFKLFRWYSFLTMQRFVARRMDRIVAVAESPADDTAKAFKIPREKFRVVYNGVDTELFHVDDSVRKQENNLIVVGGYSPIKGLTHLLKAMTLLKGEMDLKLTIIGGPPDGKYSGGLVREYGLQDSVTFTGRISHEELTKRYSAAQVAVVPSLYEGFGFPAAEAMACGLPVIASSAGALPEVVGRDGEAGVLVPPADAGSIAAALKRLMPDEGLRWRMGAAARRRVETHFTWEQAAKKTVGVYEELIADAHR